MKISRLIFKLILAGLLATPAMHGVFEMVFLPMPFFNSFAFGSDRFITQNNIPLTISKPGSYTVMEDLANQNNLTGTAIVIAAHNVTLDFNGHTLDWSGGAAGVELRPGVRNSTVKNGTIQHAASYGMIVDANGTQLEVADFKILNCGTVGLFMREGCNNIAINRIVCNNNGRDTNGLPLITDASFVTTFSRLTYATLDSGQLNDRAWCTLAQAQQAISAGVYIRGTLSNRCSQIRIHDSVFNNNQGRQNVAGLCIAFADNIGIGNSSFNSNVTEEPGSVSRNAGLLLAAANNAAIDNCLFAENVAAGDGVPSGLCLQGFGINNEEYKVRCSGIRILDCISRNNHRSLAGAPALDIHGSNFDKLWSDAVSLINCQSSHAARAFQVQECSNVSYIDCEAAAAVGVDVPWQIDNGFRGFANHHSGNIVHQRCRVLNMDQNNLVPSSGQGVEGFYASIQDSVNLAGTKRTGTRLADSPFDIFMTTTPLTGLVYTDCLVDHVIDLAIGRSNAIGITLRGVQSSRISNCIINGAERISPEALVISGTGITLEDVLTGVGKTPLVGAPRYNQHNLVVGNEVTGCMAGIADISLASTTTARCAYLENKVFKTKFPYAFSAGLAAATPIVIWQLSAGKQPDVSDNGGNPPPKWTNLAIE